MVGNCQLLSTPLHGYATAWCLLVLSVFEIMVSEVSLHSMPRGGVDGPVAKPDQFFSF